MSRRKRILRRLGGGLGLLVLVVILVAIVLAPSWRNYYLPRGSVRIIEDQIYVAQSSNPKHRLDLYLPKAHARPWPVVVFVHGGFYHPMDRRQLQAYTGLHGCVGVALANHGVATAVVSYRQVPEATTIQDALDDLSRAVRYVIDHIGQQGGDPAQVFLIGHSMGGYFTSLLALSEGELLRGGVTPGQLRGFASLGSVYDLARIMRQADPDLAGMIRSSAGNDEGLARFSPERRVRAGHPPMLLVVGDKDEPSLVEEHRHMVSALRRVGADVTAVEVPGADHMDLVMHLSRPGDRVLSELLRFIERHRQPPPV